MEQLSCSFFSMGAKNEVFRLLCAKYRSPTKRWKTLLLRASRAGCKWEVCVNDRKLASVIYHTHFIKAGGSLWENPHFPDTNVVGSADMRYETRDEMYVVSNFREEINYCTASLEFPCRGPDLCYADNQSYIIFWRCAAELVNYPPRIQHFAELRP